MLLVKEYLLTHTLQQLDEEHGVNARANASNDKFSLNYDMINVKNGDKLAEQCRGLVLRPTVPLTEGEFLTRVVGETTILAWPMNRFYNLGDGSGADVDWNDNDLSVQEKLDGTMIVAYYDPLHQKWHAATRAVPEADLPIKAGHMEIGDQTFSGLFWEAFASTVFENLDVLKQDQFTTVDDVVWKSATLFGAQGVLKKHYTYVFELTSRFNRVVVKYDRSAVTLLAVRDMVTQQEVSPWKCGLQYFVNLPKLWDLDSPTAIQSFVEQADPAQLEGCVVIDSQFRRIKIKNKAWVLASRAKDSIGSSWRNAMESVIAGTIDDVVPLVDADVGEKLIRMQKQVRDYCRAIDMGFRIWRDEADGNRRRFAELVNLSGVWVPPYFQLLDGKAPDALTWLRNMQKAEKLSANIIDTLLEQTGKVVVDLAD